MTQNQTPSNAEIFATTFADVLAGNATTDELADAYRALVGAARGKATSAALVAAIGRGDDAALAAELVRDLQSLAADSRQRETVPPAHVLAMQLVAIDTARAELVDAASIDDYRDAETLRGEIASGAATFDDDARANVDRIAGKVRDAVSTATRGPRFDAGNIELGAVLAGKHGSVTVVSVDPLQFTDADGNAITNADGEPVTSLSAAARVLSDQRSVDGPKYFGLK